MSEYYDDDVEYDVARHAGRHALSDPRWIAEFLGQSKVWQQADLSYVKIKTMEPSHALNVINYVMARALSIVAVLSVARGDSDELRANVLVDATAARYFVLNTPLLKALATRADRFDDDPDLTPPWKRA